MIIQDEAWSDEFNISDLPLKDLRNLVDSWIKTFGEDAIFAASEYGYEGGVDFYIKFNRPETKDEKVLRIKREKDKKKRNAENKRIKELKERKELERLQKKYGEQHAT